MTETVLPAEMLKLLDPAHITPLVAYLAHESNEHTGSCFEVGGGWYSQVSFAFLLFIILLLFYFLLLLYLNWVIGAISALRRN